MACCLMAPSHYLNQFWLLISEILWYSPKSNFIARGRAIIFYNEFNNHTFKITDTSPIGQWVNSWCAAKCLWNIPALGQSRWQAITWMNDDLGLYWLSGKTSYRKISSSREAARFRFKLFQLLWNLTGTSAKVLPRCLSNFRAIQSL